MRTIIPHHFRWEFPSKLVYGREGAIKEPTHAGTKTGVFQAKYSRPIRNVIKKSELTIKSLVHKRTNCAKATGERMDKYFLLNISFIF